MTSRTTKRVCLLTGASGKLGSAFCRLYNSKYDIVAVHRGGPPDVPSQLQAFVDPLSKECHPANDHPVFTVRADLQQDTQIERVVELTLARFDRIDLLVNAAADTAFLGPIIETGLRLERLRAQLNLNVIVPLALAGAVARQFWRDRFDENQAMNRSVINVSSVSGLAIYSGYGQTGYAASKAALNHASAHLADELSWLGVRVNTIAPARFPDSVPTECVAELVERLDDERTNGGLFVIDERGEHSVKAATSDSRQRNRRSLGEWCK